MGDPRRPAKTDCRETELHPLPHGPPAVIADGDLRPTRHTRIAVQRDRVLPFRTWNPRGLWVSETRAEGPNRLVQLLTFSSSWWIRHALAITARSPSSSFRTDKFV